MATRPVDDDEPSEEPKLKYKRVANGMHAVISSDDVSCLAVHAKYLAVGTHWGMISILDHLGFPIENKKFSIHSTTVNQISIDEQGEYLASCSDDGRVIVHGLYTSEHNQTRFFDRAVKAVAIAPDYSRSRQFVTGDDRLMLISKSVIMRQKMEVLHKGDGLIRNIKWRGDFIAWASDLGVKVYDMKERKLITYVTRSQDEESLRPDLYMCHIQWRSDSSLLIGWGHTVRVCDVKQRLASTDREKTMPTRYVQISQYFTIPDYICGISAHLNFLLILVFPVVASSGSAGDQQQQATGSPRPQMLIAEPQIGSYREISIDELSIRSYERHMVNHYHLESIPGENTHYIVSPKDVVCAQEPDMDDHIEWLVERNMFDEALQVAKKYEKQLRMYNSQSIGIRYIDHLLNLKQFDAAGKLCPVVVKDKQTWEDRFYKFFHLGQLSMVADHLPVDNPRLDATIYEMVLNEFLHRDLQSFLRLLQVWPKTLYSVGAMIHAILDRLDRSQVFSADTSTAATGDAISPRDKILWHSLAVLYENDGAYDKSLAIYLRLKHSYVFELIDRYNLFDVILEKIVLLLQFDHQKAIKLLLDHMNRITYLDALFSKDTQAGVEYHGRLVELYATYNRKKLLPFLRSTDHYALNTALSLCERLKFIKETVYLLGRVGRRKDALRLIMSSLEDVDQAIDYCREQGDRDLWEQLIVYSAEKPGFISALLDNTGMDIDPRTLIKKIRPEMEIPGLRNSLVKLLHDYQIQVNLREGCQRILLGDLDLLFNRQIKLQHHGIRITVPSGIACLLCGASGKKEMSLAGAPSSGHDGLVIFYCKHVFHWGCLPAEPTPEPTGIFQPTQYRCPLCAVDRSTG